MPVTWQALGLILLAVVGLGMVGFGLLSTLAAGMSDAPVAGAGNGGCTTALVGLALIIIAAILGFAI